MLLGRTASGLYWMHRYIERAENTARIVDAGLHMALTRTSDSASEWASVLISSGGQSGFNAKHAQACAATVADYLLRDTDNSSSVLSCIEAARSNARMVRTALTRETWESVNEAWMAIKRLLAEPIRASELPVTLDAIKRETALIRGTFHGTMLRNEIFNFARIGTFIERADNTARILDVKYHLLLPSLAHVGTTLDNYQWESILRCVAAHRSYRWTYEAQYRPIHVADYLILNARMPRSLHFCYRNIVENLQHLASDYRASHECHHTAGATLSHFGRDSIDLIFKRGLHEFLTSFVASNNRLGVEIAETYHFE